MSEVLIGLEGQVEVGDAVQIVDENYVQRDGLVTAVHGPSCINALYVSGDVERRDQYGRQIERLSSLQHESAVQSMPHPGRFYRKIN